MYIKSLTRYLWPCIILFTVFTSAVKADDDYVEARHLLDAGKILPLEQIIKNARNILPGKILEVEFEKENQTFVYELEILGKDGVTREIYIDAATGRVLSIKEDD